MSPRAGNAPTEPTIMVSLDKNDIDGDGSTSDTVTLELLRDRLGSVIACSTDANQGKAGPFVVERIDYMGGYGAAAYSDIILSGYVSAVTTNTVTLDTYTHFESGVTSLSPLTNSLAYIDPGSDDSDYNLVTSASWNSGDIDLTTTAYANFSVGDYIEIWSKPLKRHSSTTPTESNGRTTVTTAAGFSPLSSDALVGCYLMDLDAGDLRVPVVITDNDTSGFTVEGTNLYTDTEFADGENYFRVYRRSSAVGNPFGFAGGWLVGRNYVDTGRFNRSVKQLWYFWNRHYEPEYLLRWLQPDPIGPWGDTEQLGGSMSRTVSPLSWVDTAGLSLGVFFGGTNSDGKLFGALQQVFDAYGDGVADQKIVVTEGGPDNFARTGAFNGIEDRIEDVTNLICKLAVCPKIAYSGAVRQTYNSDPDKFGIDLFGNSRGAVTAQAVAHLLNTRGCRCGNQCRTIKVPVRTLVMLDPVNFSSSINSDWTNSIGDNVHNFLHLRADRVIPFEDIIFPQHDPGRFRGGRVLRKFFPGIGHHSLATLRQAGQLIVALARAAGAPMKGRGVELVDWKLNAYNDGDTKTGSNWKSAAEREWFRRHRDIEWWKPRGKWIW